MLDRPSNYFSFFFFLIFFQTRLGHITSAKVCKDKALLICIIIVTAFELTNQLLYLNFPCLERKIFQTDHKSTLPSSVAL